jgi:glycosyltransferase involved in cell wall biosynthesis
MKVGFYSPLPPARTGVADYSAALLTALCARGTVELDAADATVRLYHLGNNQLHRPVYERAIETPGVVVLHDAVLQHFFLGSLDEPAYVDEFVYNYGEWSRSLAAELYRARAASSADRRYFQYPMLRRIVERSRVVIVHNPAAAALAQKHAAQARIVEIPHLFTAPRLATPAEVLRFRQKLDLPACAFVFGVFGYLREAKRVLAILRAFELAREQSPKAYLLLAGDFVSDALARAVQPWLSRPWLRRLPYLAESDFWRAALATDACISLRDPAAGETSGIAIRFMGIGKPVLVTAGVETSRFPDASCVRIDPGVAETAGLRDHIRLFTSFPQVACEVGQRGAGHIAAHHSVDRVAEAYWNVLCEYDG